VPLVIRLTKDSKKRLRAKTTVNIFKNSLILSPWFVRKSSIDKYSQKQELAMRILETAKKLRL